MSKHLHAGRAAESGLLAAELAAHGFTGPPRILEGEKGMFAAMCADPDPDAILADPDAPWQLHRTSTKPWPSCRHTHPAIDCALELHGKLNGAEVEKVDISTYRAALDVCDRPNPENDYQAKFSLYHCVAIALRDGVVKLDSFTEQARARCAELRAATTVQVVDPFASRYPVSWGSGVRLTTRGGDIWQPDALRRLEQRRIAVAVRRNPVAAGGPFNTKTSSKPRDCRDRGPVSAE